MDFIALDLRMARLQLRQSQGVKGKLFTGLDSIRVGEVSALSDLRAGTILTIIEQPTAAGGWSTDLSFSPGTGDWWINLCAADPAVLGTDGVVMENGASQTLAPGIIRVNSDSWMLALRDRTGAVAFGPAGISAGAGGFFPLGNLEPLGSPGRRPLHIFLQPL
jgi:hypothetical protein